MQIESTKSSGDLWALPSFNNGRCYYGKTVMSYADAWSALNLEMPPRIPRTEHSAHIYHWPLTRAVIHGRMTDERIAHGIS